MGSEQCGRSNARIMRRTQWLSKTVATVAHSINHTDTSSGIYPLVPEAITKRILTEISLVIPDIISNSNLRNSKITWLFDRVSQTSTEIQWELNPIWKISIIFTLVEHLMTSYENRFVASPVYAGCSRFPCSNPVAWQNYLPESWKHIIRLAYPTISVVFSCSNAHLTSRGYLAVLTPGHFK